MPSKSLMELAVEQAKKNQNMTEKQQKIFEAAIKMFAEKGYASTSTSEIAKAAGVAEGTIFRHFGSKENLLFSIIFPILIETVPLAAEEFITGVLTKSYISFETFLVAFIKDRFDFAKENKEILKILIMEFLHREELRSQIIAFFQNAPLKHINALLDTFKQRGELADLPNSTLIRTLLTQIAGFFAVRLMAFPDTEWDDSREIENLVHVILKGIGTNES